MGTSDTRPLVIIQARRGGTRFPGKVLSDLGGAPMYQRVYERASLLPGADVVTAWAHEVGGVDEHDVLGRYASVVAFQFPEADPIVRVTADCPLWDWGVARDVLRLYRTVIMEEAYPGHWVATSPEWDGLDVEVFSRMALFSAHRVAESAHDREHVTPYIRRTYLGVEVGLPAPYGPLRFSVDDPDGLAFVRAVYAACEHCAAGHPHRTRDFRPNWAIHDVYGLHPDGAPEPMACEAWALLESRVGGPVYVSGGIKALC